MKKDEKITLWSERIHEFQSSGQTCKTWCQEHRIPVSTMNYWMRKLKTLDEQSDTDMILQKCQQKKKFQRMRLWTSARRQSAFLSQTLFGSKWCRNAHRNFFMFSYRDWKIMLDLAGGTTVYLACGATDLRKSYHDWLQLSSWNSNSIPIRTACLRSATAGGLLLRFCNGTDPVSGFWWRGLTGIPFTGRIVRMNYRK